jgi:hypothetical protein
MLHNSTLQILCPRSIFPLLCLNIPVKKTEITPIGIRRAVHATPCICNKLALSSATTGRPSFGIVRSRTNAAELCFMCLNIETLLSSICSKHPESLHIHVTRWKDINEREGRQEPGRRRLGLENTICCSVDWCGHVWQELISHAELRPLSLTDQLAVGTICLHTRVLKTQYWVIITNCLILNLFKDEYLLRPV